MKVLLPVDGSQCAKATMQWAAKMLDKSTARFYVLTVIPHGAPELVTEEYQVEDALKVLNESEAELKSLGCQVEKTEYVEGDPVDAICQYANEMDVDQILIGSHGRTGLAKMLLGSVSTGVMERSEKPVFVYKNIECKTELASKTSELSK